MGQFTFPLTVRDSVLQWMDAIPGSSLEQMERSIDKYPDSTWYNYRCRVHDAVALISISEHQRLPSKLLVTVSTDLRRIWRLTKLFKDFRLSFAIADILKMQGGVAIDD